MNARIREAIVKAAQDEPLAVTFGMRLAELEDGFSAVEMLCRPGMMDNLFGRTHGGAIYSLIDEAFETAAQTDGTICVALNVSVSYIVSPEPGSLLRAEAKKISQTRKTAGYEIRVTDTEGTLIAICQATAYRTGKPLPFL
jgi:acyl-CoA thioesterase